MGAGTLRAWLVPGRPIILKGRLRGPAAEAQVRLLLDTGATWTLIRPRVLDKVGIDLQRVEESRPITTVSGVARTSVVTTSGLAILGVLRESFKVVTYDLPPSAPIDGLLGLDFLVDLRLTLDMRAGELTVEA